MKLPYLLLTVFLLGSPMAHGADNPTKSAAVPAPPPATFASVEELQRWASTSTFGGGAVQSSQLGDQTVYVATRSFTSGRPSTELSLYTVQAGGSGLTGVLFQPIRPAELRPQFTKESLIIEQYNPSTRTWLVCLTVTPSFFQSATFQSNP